MKKRIKTYLLVAGMLIATSTVAIAAQGPTISGRSGRGTVYAYVQIVDKEGYVLGNTND